MTPAMKARRVAGHDGALRPAPEVNMPAFVPASSLRSTANDLLRFLSAFTGTLKSPLAPAMRTMLDTRRPGPGFQQAIGWWIVPLAPGDEGIVFHGGQTPGFSSAIEFDPKTGRGVVVLSNDMEDDGGLSWHLLRPNFPIATSEAAKAKKEKRGRRSSSRRSCWIDWSGSTALPTVP
jgi:CubicO group peptidase (beta-lactamase class C family)